MRSPFVWKQTCPFRDTIPEVTIRVLLHHLGLRFRLCCKGLAGNPDLVLRKYRTVIFVHGCFWHGHGACGVLDKLKQKREKWLGIIEKRMQRDAWCVRKLEEQGWRVIVLWECEIHASPIEQVKVVLGCIGEEARIKQARLPDKKALRDAVQNFLLRKKALKRRGSRVV